MMIPIFFIVSSSKDQGVIDEFQDLDDLHVQAVMLDDVVQTVDAVVTHGADKLGPGVLKLAGFYRRRFHPQGPVFRHRELSSPSGATIVFGPIRVHFPEIGANLPKNPTGLFGQSPGAGDIA
jgi:hypothetical protein